MVHRSTKKDLERVRVGAQKNPKGTSREKAINKNGEEILFENIGKSGTIEMDLQFFAKKHKTKKVPNDNPLWDSLVQGNIKQQLEEGIFEWEHSGYDYLIEIKEKFDYEILSKKKKPNIHG